MATDLSNEPEEDEYVVSNPNMHVYQCIKVQVDAHKCVNLRNIKASWTVEEFMRHLRDNEPEYIGREDFTLTFRSQAINEQKEKTLAQIGLQENSTIVTLWKVIGGAAATEVEGEERQYPKDTKTWLKKIKPSKEQCFSSSCELPEGFHNAQVPCCQTVVSAQAAYNMLYQTIFYTKLTSLVCKFKSNCNKPISFGYYAWLAQLNSNERKNFKEKFEKKALIKPNGDLQRCPNANCGAYVERKEGFPRRVRCPVCRAYDWCWVCREKWTGSGDSKCGNANCDPTAEIFDRLLNCEKKTISGVPNVPTVRLCRRESCRTMIEWTEKCKHVACTQCFHEFCMVCWRSWIGHSEEECKLLLNENIQF